MSPDIDTALEGDVQKVPGLGEEVLKIDLNAHSAMKMTENVHLIKRKMALTPNQESHFKIKQTQTHEHIQFQIVLQ